MESERSPRIYCWRTQPCVYEWDIAGFTSEIAQSDIPCFQNSRLAARIRAGPPKIFSESSWSSQTTILAKTGSKEAANFMLDIVTRIEQIMIVSNGN